MLQDSPAAIQFMDKLIEEKGLGDLDPEIHEQLRSDLLDRLSNRINRDMLNAMNDQQITEFEALFDNNEVDKIKPFLYKCGINTDELVARAMVEFREMYLKV